MKTTALAAIMALSMMATGSALAAEGVFDNFTYQGADASVAPNQYANPILRGFQPDPSVLRVGDDYYLLNSSFGYYPGVPIYHSKDMVSWRQIGNVLTGQTGINSLDDNIDRGIFAPTIAYHDGVFYMVTTCIDCGGNFLVTATNPAGPWSEPTWLNYDGIDPSIFFDDDGRAYMVNNGPPDGPPQYSGHRAIWIQEFDAANKRLIGPRSVLVNGGVDISTQPVWAEGPHLFKHNGYYYLNCAEGGTHVNHSQTIYRSRSPMGPFVPGPNNPILTQRDLPADRPNVVQSTGHADLVELPDGSWWAVFLATRPYSGSFTNLGRETFLLPVTWQDGWPTILPHGVGVPLVQNRPLPAAPNGPENANAYLVPQGNWSEDFSAPNFNRDWLWMRSLSAPRLSVRRQALNLAGTNLSASAHGQPAFIGRRLRHHQSDMAIDVRLTHGREGDRAGLLIFANETHHYQFTLEQVGRGADLVVRVRDGANDPQDGRVLARQSLGRDGLRQGAHLYVHFNNDKVDFAYGVGNGPRQNILTNADTILLSTDRAAMFTGTLFGPFVQNAH